jgi:hypothetical protein
MADIRTLIEKHNKDNADVLKKILVGLKPVEEAIKTGRKLCFSLDPNNMDKIKELELRMTGQLSQLKELYSKVESLKRNKELAIYMALKIKAEESEGAIKFVDGASKMEAAFAVADERQVRDRVEGLLKSTDDIVKTCRNLVNGQSDSNDISIDKDTAV